MTQGQDGWRLYRRGDKWVFEHPGAPALVLKIWQDAQIVPRWRIAGAAVFSAFSSGIAFSHDRPIGGAILGALALGLCWALGRWK